MRQTDGVKSWLARVNERRDAGTAGWDERRPLRAFLVPAALWFHAFWKMPEDQQQMHSQLFFRNLTLIGACIALFAVFTGIGDGLRYTITDALVDLT